MFDLIYSLNEWLKRQVVMWLGDPLEHEIDRRIEIHEVNKLRRQSERQASAMRTKEKVRPQ